MNNQQTPAPEQAHHANTREAKEFWRTAGGQHNRKAGRSKGVRLNRQRSSRLRGKQAWRERLLH